MSVEVGFPSKVYRQIVTAEIVWTEDGERRDWGAEVRGGVLWRPSAVQAVLGGVRRPARRKLAVLPEVASNP